jgi:hypothetical protein
LSTCSRGGAIDRAVNAAGAGRYDAGALGIAWRHEIIPLCPNSPRECFDLTIKALNLAEECKFVDRDRLDHQTVMRTQYVESLGERYIEEPEMECVCG